MSRIAAVLRAWLPYSTCLIPGYLEYQQQQGSQLQHVGMRRGRRAR